MTDNERFADYECPSCHTSNCIGSFSKREKDGCECFCEACTWRGKVEDLAPISIEKEAVKVAIRNFMTTNTESFLGNLEVGFVDGRVNFNFSIFERAELKSSVTVAEWKHLEAFINSRFSEMESVAKKVKAVEEKIGKSKLSTDIVFKEGEVSNGE